MAPDSSEPIVGRLRTTAVVALAVLLAAGTTALVVFLLSGARLFVIETPSMATAAPIGSLVVTMPVAWARLHVGEIITFHPPTDPAETYTHRIVALTAHGIRTRGDLNGATDGWVLRAHDIVGRAALIAPGAGWLVEMLPLLALGCGLAWWLAGRIASREWRLAARHLGVAVTVLATLDAFRPLVRVITLGYSTSAGHAHVWLVSEGLLPVSVRASGGARMLLHYGQSGVLRVAPDLPHHAFRVAERVTPPAWVWALVLLAAYAPLLWRALHPPRLVVLRPVLARA